MELNERQWQAGMNFRIDAPDMSYPAFEACLAALDVQFCDKWTTSALLPVMEAISCWSTRSKLVLK